MIFDHINSLHFFIFQFTSLHFYYLFRCNVLSALSGQRWTFLLHRYFQCRCQTWLRWTNSKENKNKLEEKMVSQWSCKSRVFKSCQFYRDHMCDSCCPVNHVQISNCVCVFFRTLYFVIQYNFTFYNRKLIKNRFSFSSTLI